jgi:hypothetical protein
MAVESSTLGKIFILDVLQNTGGTENINIAGSEIVDASVNAFKIKGVQVDVITGASGANVNVHKGTATAANRVCAQTVATTAGSFTPAMAPIDGRSVANLSFVRSDTLNINIGGGAARVRVRIHIGQGIENTIATTS